MDVTIRKTHYFGERNFSGSKSLTHRLLIASLYTNDIIYIDNIANNDDIMATISVLKTIGKKIDFIDDNSIIIHKGEIKHFDVLEIDVKASASTLRFMMPLLLNITNKLIINCNDNLINRPIDEYLKLQDKCNLSIHIEGNKIIASGNMNLDYYEIDGSVSSQYITGLIINALFINSPTTIKVNEPFNSKSYVDLTVDCYNKMGLDISYEDNTYYIHKHNNIITNEFTVEGDYSTAANFITLAALNGRFIGTNLDVSSLQSDKVIIDLLKSIGANINFVKDEKENRIVVENTSLLEKGFAKQLRAFNIDISNCIDLGPLLMVLASFTNGTSNISNVDRLKVKESNRLDVMLNHLTTLGVDIKYNNNNVIIKGKKDYSNRVTLDSYNDHRIIMALSLFATLNNGEITITNVDKVSKSDPNFFKYLIQGTKEHSVELN